MYAGLIGPDDLQKVLSTSLHKKESAFRVASVLLLALLLGRTTISGASRTWSDTRIAPSFSEALGNIYKGDETSTYEVSCWDVVEVKEFDLNGDGYLDPQEFRRAIAFKHHSA